MKHGLGLQILHRLVCDDDSSLLSCRQFLDVALGGAHARFRGLTLIVSRHRLHDEVFVIVLATCLHLNRLELLLQAPLL